MSLEIPGSIDSWRYFRPISTTIDEYNITKNIMAVFSILSIFYGMVIGYYPVLGFLIFTSILLWSIILKDVHDSTVIRRYIGRDIYFHYRRMRFFNRTMITLISILNLLEWFG